MTRCNTVGSASMSTPRKSNIDTKNGHIVKESSFF